MRIEIACVTSPVHVAMLDKGDLDGYDVWNRILRAVEELRRVEPGLVGTLQRAWQDHGVRAVLPHRKTCRN